MMDTLKEARGLIDMAADHYGTADEGKDDSAYYRSLGDEKLRYAAILAAVAQAEQLERIANALESVIFPHSDNAVRVDDGKP